MVHTSDSPALVARSLTCERGGRRLFFKLDLTLHEGDALVLRGPNASGKSSLLRVLAGLLDPVEGAVLWHGQDTREHPGPWRRSLAYLGHGNALKPQLSVRQNLSFWQAMEHRAAPVEEALEQMGLLALADLPASMLSAGQQRRLAIARLAMRKGGCWLMDEPTVTLDARSLDGLCAMIEEHRNLGGVAILATHEDLAVRAPVTLNLGAQS
jgi:heme exporter protein A